MTLLYTNARAEGRRERKSSSFNHEEVQWEFVSKLTRYSKLRFVKEFWCCCCYSSKKRTQLCFPVGDNLFPDWGVVFFFVSFVCRGVVLFPSFFVRAQTAARTTLTHLIFLYLSLSHHTYIKTKQSSSRLEKQPPKNPRAHFPRIRTIANRTWNASSSARTSYR